MRLRSGLALCLVVVLVLCAAPRALAQATVSFAQLNGTVQDESGRAIVKASITLRELSTNLRYTATSNEAGFYLVPNLPPGQYELTVEYTGLGKYVETGIALRVGQTATTDVTLRVAAKEEKIEVTGQVPTVEPTRTEVSQVIETAQIQQLPTSRRNFVDFALLTPGVATGRTSIQSTFTETETTRISFGGMRDLSNALTVDGADFINMATGSQRATPSQEAVSEFRVVNNGYGAEYGRALGGIVNVVTKSGSNDYHGSVYVYHNNAWANARTLLTLPQFDAYRRTQYGATLGGPIQKDKTFFFANYEGQRFAQSPTYPTTLINNLTLVNQAKAAMNLPPETLGGLKTLDHDNGFVKLDHQINSNNRLGLRYVIVDERDLNVLVGDTLDGGGIGAPSSGHNTFLRDQSLSGSLSSVLKPSLVNTALVQYARRHYNFPAVTGQPNLDIPNTLLFGHNFGTFDATNESRVQISDSLSWVKGNHYLKFGGDFNHVWDFVIWPGFTPMRIILPGFNCMVQFANFVDPSAGIAEVPQDGPCPLPPFFNGVPIAFWGAPLGTGPVVPGSLPPVVPPTPVGGVNQWPNGYMNPPAYYAPINHSYVGFFAQDQWRLTPKLTLNYGLRWDFEAGLTEIINHDFRGWQPRIGLAYSPNKRTVIRAGYGIFDDHYNMTFFFVTYPQREVVIPGAPQPFVRLNNATTAGYALNQLPVGLYLGGLQYPSATTYSTPDCPNETGTAVPAPWCAAKELVLTGQNPPNFNTGPAGSAVTNSGGGWDRNARISYSEQASLQIDEQIGKSLVVSAGYLFVGSHKQVRPMNLNVCPPAGFPASPAYPNWVPPGGTFCPASGLPNNKLPDGKDAFSGPLFSNAGLMYYLDNTGVSVYHGGSLSVTDRIGSYLRFGANYTLSHVRDDGTFTTFVSTPQDQYNRALERADSVQDVRHRFIANFTADTPQKSVLRNFELSGIVTLQSGRPFTIFVGNDVNGDTNPVTDRVGLSPRNSYRGDKLYNTDLRVSRMIHIKENLGLLLAFDAFNVFNRPNVDEVTSVYGGGTIDFCGVVPKHYKDAASLAIQKFGVACPGGNGGAPFPNPLFGTPRTMFNARQLQISGKFTF
ncbi:MAG: TonB-dependent receptor [Acidobacteriia bacterium]|nr:TonB-dependent receptor [Terriglobia bacterium]